MKYYIEIFKRFNDFYGKADRSEFIGFARIHAAIICVLMFLGYATDHALAIKVIDTVTGLFVVGSILPCAAVIVRRLNALGRNSKLVFAALVPVVGLLYLVGICMQNENSEKSGFFKGLFDKNPKRQSAS